MLVKPFTFLIIPVMDRTPVSIRRYPKTYIIYIQEQLPRWTYTLINLPYGTTLSGENTTPLVTVICPCGVCSDEVGCSSRRTVCVFARRNPVLPSGLDMFSKAKCKVRIGTLLKTYLP